MTTKPRKNLEIPSQTDFLSVEV